MNQLLLVWYTAVLIAVVAVNPEQDQDGEVEAKNFMAYYNREMDRRDNIITIAEWDYETNLTDFNLQKKLKVSAEIAAWKKEQWHRLVKYPYKSYQDPQLRRQFKLSSILGSAALPEDKRARLDQVVAEMTRIYSTTKLQKWQDGPPSSSNGSKKTIALEPDLNNILGNEFNNPCKLKYYWHGWHKTVGRAVRPLFEEYVSLTNEAARLNNFSNNAEMWIDDFEMSDFEDQIHKLYMQILPLYTQLHTHVRRKLADHYNNARATVVEKNSFIPAHLLGNVWAQQWDNIYNLTVPYPHKTSLDVSETMIAQNYTPYKMFKLSEEFYTSLNLSAMTDTFWKKSIIEKQEGVDMVCHASAWDFYDGEDYRIKMCTRVNLEDLKTVHHEMGHIQYFQQYKNQPAVFKTGANSGFHEAVGDTLALSVSTAEHLMKIGLLDPETYVEDKESEINSLYLMALEKVAFLPYAYVLDLWRWEIFRGNITPAEYNCRFWKLRQDLQGITPPVHRTEKDFDAGAKYHVIGDVPYIRYFVSFIIQFQFHKALCIKAGQYDPKNPSLKPLHQCDIYQSTEAGNLMGAMLQMGASKQWQDTFEVITGQRDMDAGPLLEYFKPLMDWLTFENNRTGEDVGWGHTHKVYTCRNTTSPETAGEVEDDNCHYNFFEAKEKIEEVKEENKQTEEGVVKT